MRTMAIAAALLAAASWPLACGPAHAQRMSKLSGAQLVRVCGEAKSRGICDGYISGVADGIAGIEHQTDRADASSFKGAVCIPNDTDVSALRSTVLDFIRAHPDMTGKPAAVPTYEALRASFACKS